MSKLCRWLVAILVFTSFLICFACGIEAERSASIVEVEVTPETPTPTEPSSPETSIPTTFILTTSKPELNVESEEVSPSKSVEPSAEELFWQKCSEEYPVATEIWLQMKSYGWTDAACAGIMGNIMRETGGDTLLYVQSNIFNKRGTHYGLCQWSCVYYPEIHPTSTWIPSTVEQVNYLRHTIVHQQELNHSYGFSEDYLITATDCREVAKVFCEGYERPVEDPSRRMDNAEIAWKYFVLGEEI